MQGRTLGDFELVERLGQGGSGVVYRAIQKSLARSVVVKVLLASPSDSGAERFLREARLASLLDHPFAAHVYGFGVEPDVLWIAMELVRGTTLDHMIAKHGPVPLARFVPFFERLCEVLQAVHDQGIVHRDIKPSNVMVLSRSGRLLPKLLDLGIARRSFDAPGDVLAPAPGREKVLEPDFMTHSEVVVSGDGTPSESDTLASRLASSETHQLTSVGVVVGTPHYMAPEQWADASQAGVPADLYSLSILAYQAVTGKPPFRGRSLRQMATAHAQQALPELPRGMPATLYAVLAKGAAKDPAHRFSSAIELGAAVRAAADLEAAPFALPQLADDLRTSALTDAPQPIAEAVALVEAARTPKEQLEAITMLHRVCVRYLACIALASRARVGTGDTRDDPSAVAMVKSLSAGTFGSEQWQVLAQTLCRPFALKKNAYPVPELVSFFFDGDKPGAGARALNALAELGVPAPTASDADIHASLLRMMPATDGLLRSLAFVFDYPLVVFTTVPERWLGTRRARRLTQTIQDPTPPMGIPFLVDAAGKIVLVLDPLMKIMSPGALLAEELFMLDGAGRHGTRMLALPARFERQSDEVWPWFSLHIADVSTVARGMAEENHPPYKGLSAFGLEDAENYFGRDLEAETFANRLHASSTLLAVIGPSGSGKSSFVLAGVLPLLPSNWKHVVARPGAEPVRALLLRLSQAGLPVSELTAQALLGTLRADEPLLIVIDQFEELITLCPDPALRDTFAALLVRLANDSSNRFRVVITLRDDFLIKAQQLEALRPQLSSGLQLLGAPARDDLMQVVTEPARRVGYGFDDATLPARMVDEVAAYPGALALLSFAASQLWAMRDRHLHLMRVKTYEALGGVGGALANHAETTLAQLEPDEAELVREAFRHLVTSAGTRSVVSRTEMLELLGKSTAAHTVLTKLIDARLLVTFENASGDDRVELIHEALITAWPRLAGWLREDAETARLRDTLRGSAKQWAERGRPAGLLWRKETLAEYRVWRVRFRGRLTENEEAFTQACLREEARLVMLRRGLTLAAFTVLSAGVVLLSLSQREAQASAKLAIEKAQEVNQRMRDLRVEQARLALLDDKPFQAMRYAQAGRALGSAGTTLTTIERAVDQLLAGQREAVYLGGEQHLVAARESTRIGALDAKGALVVLSVPELKQVAAIKGDGGRFASAMFLPDSTSGLLCQTTGVVTRWREGSNALELHRSKKPIISCAFSAVRKTLTVLLETGTVQTWRLLTHPDEHLELVAEVELRAPYSKLLVSHSGDWVVAYSRTPGAEGGSTAHVLGLADGKIVSRLATGEVNDTSADFFDERHELALGSYDSTIRIFDVVAGVLRTQLKGHASDVTSVSYRSDGAALLSTSVDGTARVWAASGITARTLLHRGPLESGAYLENGAIMTTLMSGGISLWGEVLPEPVTRFLGHASAPSVAALGTTRFASSAADGAVRLWEYEVALDPPALTFVQGLTALIAVSNRPLFAVALDDGQVALMHRESLVTASTRRNPDCKNASALAAGTFGSAGSLVGLGSVNFICLFDIDAATTRTLRGHQAAIARLAFDQQGRRLASSARDGSVIVWDLETDNPVFEFHHPAGVRGITFSPDGAQLFAGLDDGQIYRYSLKTGARELAIEAHGGFVRTLRFVGDHLLSVSADQTAASWSTDLRLERRFVGGTDPLAWVDLSASGELLVTAGFNGEIVVWDFARGWPLVRFNPGAGMGDVWWVEGGAIITEFSNLGRVRKLNVLGESGFRRECINPLVLGENGFMPRQSFEGCR